MRIVTLVFLSLAVLIVVLAVPLALATGPQGVNLIVTSAADSGPGTLHQAMLDAKSGDTITFDPAVFPPGAPVTIYLTSELPHMYVGNLTIDGSNAGVILDGTNMPGEWQACLQIVNSNANFIRGLQITNFSGAGVAISGESQFNVIGGDRSVGAGPYGQGNLFTHNDVGVVISSASASQNTITGNLIGTDASGTEEWGNAQQGIWLVEAATGNTIGPDNVIAHNGRTGIEVQGRETVGNTITRNSIHDHPSLGISLWTEVPGPEALPIRLNRPVPPTIFVFDLGAGTVAGTTCPGCTIEIFSDSGDEGAHFEGQTTADARGVYTFNKGASLTGPLLTATTTGLDGTTSEFSVPTPGTAAGSLTLQEGNDAPAAYLQTRRSSELVGSGIGTEFSGYANPGTWDEFLFYDQGLKRARVALQAKEPEYIRWEWPDTYIPPGYEDVFTRMAENGIKVKLVLMFWDKATWPDGVGAPCARFKTEGEIERYLEFVQTMVHHFKDRIQYYELWNEPDIPNYCPKWIEVEDYINLVRRTVPVIRAEYPEAKIVVGAVSGINEPPAREYLLTLLGSDVMPLVDVISWHANGPAPECEHHQEQDYYYGYPSWVQEIKDVARAHGFEGEFEGNEMGYRSPETSNPEDQCVQGSRTIAAKYTSRSIVRHLGMDVAINYVYGADYILANHATVMAGVEPAVLPMQIQTTATNIVSYTFSLPGDARLAALWTDGIGVDYDPGVTATVTISGLQDYDTFTGIDLLHGFEQPVIASEENGNLVIRDLLVKDYPIILRFSNTRYVYLPVLVKD